jgi:hypothetical protein
MGFGMVFLQTLTRIHISATLVGVQIWSRCDDVGEGCVTYDVGAWGCVSGLFERDREKGGRIEMGGVGKEVDYLCGIFEEVSEGAV